VFEEITANLYRIEIPLPRSPLKSLNSYLIKGEGRFLLVDTGMNRDECLSEMSAALTSLNVDLAKTDFFITHLHVDHLGLAERLVTGTSTVYFNRVEASMVSQGSKREAGWTKTDAAFLANGFPADELKVSVARHPRAHFGLTRHMDFHILREGYRLSVGDYAFECIETPGHSPGHICLYEPVKKILIAGDHILFDITPNITYWFNLENPLQAYLASLRKVYDFDIALVLPGHRRIMGDHRKRIRELEEHHRSRLNEVVAALRDGAKTAFQVTPYLTWDIEFQSWAQFPAQQKWFAFGETLAHLKYLEAEGTIQSNIEGDQTVYSI